MPSRLTKATLPKLATPLWVVSLFVSLTEVTTSVALAQTTGTVQILLVIFVIVFPLLIAGAFFLILWYRPFVFYSPTEYGRTNVRAFVEAMQRRTVDETEMVVSIREEVRRTLSSREVLNQFLQQVSEDSKPSVEGVSAALQSVAGITIQNIEGRFISIDPRPLIPSGELIYHPFNAQEVVSEFLDRVYYAFARRVPAYSYGDVWFLQDITTGVVFRDIGIEYCKTHGDSPDLRSLAQVGISHGSKLRLIPAVVEVSPHAIT